MCVAKINKLSCASVDCFLSGLHRYQKRKAQLRLLTTMCTTQSFFWACIEGCHVYYVRIIFLAPNAAILFINGLAQ